MRKLTIISVLGLAGPAAAHPVHLDDAMAGPNALWLGLGILALAFGIGIWQGLRATKTGE